MSVSANDIGWSHYHNNEGPFYGGTINVAIAGRVGPFYDRVFSLVSAAEGRMDSINMYDTGLVSVGAVQFIDAGSFQVTDMLGVACDELGTDAVVAELKPALDLCGAMFSKSGNTWRFSLNGQTVNTLALQKLLYFGDANGNSAGSYTDAKRLRAKTWAACLASVWQLPGAGAVQKQFAIPRLISGFTWGQLRTDLFAGEQPEDGWVGALRAMLLAFAVNAPAVVVKRYAACRDNGKQFKSAEWCLAVLRGVVVGSNIDVWPARWVAQRPLAKAMFGVDLPTYQQLVAGPPSPAPVDVVPDPEPAPPEPPVEPPQPQPAPVPEPPAPTPAPIVPMPAPSGAIAIIVQLVKLMIEVLSRVFRKDPS